MFYPSLLANLQDIFRFSRIPYDGGGMWGCFEGATRKTLLLTQLLLSEI